MRFEQKEEVRSQFIAESLHSLVKLNVNECVKDDRKMAHAKLLYEYYSLSNIHR